MANQPIVVEADPGFGRTFTPHMVVATFRDGRWSDAEVVAFDALSLSPAAMVLHYGQAIFEGLKAYRQPDGSIALFRAELNERRFAASAHRLAMPPLEDGMFVDACHWLVDADQHCVPATEGQSLYLRPMMIATEPALGVRPANEYLFIVIGSPAGSYFGDGTQPITVWVSDEHTRAAPYGTGAAKVAGNYAASLAAKAAAARRECDDVLFLDAVEQRWIEELSGMNVVLVRVDGGRTTLVSPAPHGTILDGITRASILKLAAHLGCDVDERPVSLDEVLGGEFDEAFACGTAAVVAPIGAIRSSHGHLSFGDAVGPVTHQLRTALVDIQEGRSEDLWGWRDPVRHPVRSSLP